LSTQNAILFDLDGTILDTAHDLTMALNKVVQRYNPTKEFTLAEARRVVGYGSEAIFHELLPEYTPHVSFAEFSLAFREAYTKENHGGTTFFEGMAELITELNVRQIAWGIVTNKTEAGAKQAAQHFKLLQTAHCIVGCDTVGQGKPSPAPLLHGCKEINVLPEHCLFVGDTVIDMEAAHHAKLKSLAVDYGYGTKDILRGKFPPFAWIKSPLEILHFIG
jgi:phosphoglycolate phosphatase